MNIGRKRSWELPERDATEERYFFSRRTVLAGAGIAGAAILGSGLWAAGDGMAAAPRALPVNDDPTADLYPAKRQSAYRLDRPLTDEGTASTYNNFYEFGSHKKIAKSAQNLQTRPWTVRIDGLVEKPFTIDIDTLIRKMALEERLYRHRCVEAWAMAVPWTGFPMSALVALARPTSEAKYVRMETFLNDKVAPGQREFWYPWPYVEGLTLGEATNELAFLVTGVYGKPLAKQFGAPLRLVTPWKYGFKSIKSIVRIEFTKTRPVSFWQKANGEEYGFWANVNPEMPHRRWSQATERMLGTDEVRKTMLFNGYAEQVAHLYPDLKDRQYFF